MTCNNDEKGFSFPSFMRLINSMCRVQYCKNLKRKISNKRGNGTTTYNTRNNEYVIVRDCHIRHNLLNIKRRQTPNKFKKYSSNCKQDGNIPSEKAVHNETISLQSTNLNSNEQLENNNISTPTTLPPIYPNPYLPMYHPTPTYLPMYHPTPTYLPTMYPMSIQISPAVAIVDAHPPDPNICTKLESLPDTISITVETIPKEKFIYTDNISEVTVDYIRSAKKLKFKQRPPKNVFFPWLDDIII